MLRNALGSGGVRFPRKKRCEGVRFNVISITRWWVGVKFPEKKRYVRMSPKRGGRRIYSSSSSSNTVQGSVLLPHYRTLEVRPGRIS